MSSRLSHRGCRQIALDAGEPRFRIGVFEDKIVDWQGWHLDYDTGQEAIHELAKAIKKDLAKFRLYEIQENKDIPEEKRH